MQGCGALCQVLEAEPSDIGKVKLRQSAKSSQTINNTIKINSTTYERTY
jgi:hypothetical protein